MSEESSNRSSSHRSLSRTPPYSPIHSQFSYLRAQQRYMQEQMDSLTAQMAVNYHNQPHEPRDQSQERRGSVSIQFPQSSEYYHIYESS